MFALGFILMLLAAGYVQSAPRAVEEAGESFRAPKAEAAAAAS